MRNSQTVKAGQLTQLLVGVAACALLSGCNQNVRIRAAEAQSADVSSHRLNRPAVVIIDAKTLLDTHWGMEGPGFVVEALNYQSLDQLWANASWYASEEELQANIAGRIVASKEESEFALKSLWDRGLPNTFLLRQGNLPQVDLLCGAQPTPLARDKSYFLVRLPGQKSGTAGVLMPGPYLTGAGPVPAQHLFIRDIGHLSTVLKETHTSIIVSSNSKSMIHGGGVEGWPPEMIEQIRRECDAASATLYATEPVPPQQPPLLFNIRP